MKKIKLRFKETDGLLRRFKIDSFQKNHSPLKAILILIFSILMAEVCIKSIFIAIPAFDRPMINSVILMAILLPTLYFYIYKPMSSQYAKLKKSEEGQRKLSHLDELTGLYNRRGFILYANHLLKLANRSKKDLLLVYADLDRLKSINDHLGHERGDTAIVCVANVLAATFRGSDVIGRVGGDEFTILTLDSKEDNSDVLRNRLNKNLKEAKCNDDPECALTVSLGIATYRPGDFQSIEDLIEQADAFMYAAKRIGHVTTARH